jgi:Fe-S oxidoreductase
MTPSLALTLVAFGLVLAIAVEAGRRVALWRVGGPAAVAWLPGILALPRRYLVDVHHVVARDPYAARMHALVAGGLLGGSALLLLGILPPLQDSRIFWALTTLAFAAMLAGAAMVGRRRYPKPPARLSRGRFQWLPALFAAYGAGAFLIALDAALGRALPALGLAGLALATAGGFGLAAQVGRGPLRHALAGAVNLVAHPRPSRFAGVRDTGLAPLDLEAPKLGVERPADFAWNRLAMLDACVQCGRCEEACPAFAAGQPLTPKKLIQDLAAAIPPGGGTDCYTGRPYPQEPEVRGRGGPGLPLVGVDAMIHPDTLWSCTTCRACVEACPMMIEHVDAIVSLRRFQTLELGAVPPKAEAPLAELRHADEPGGRPLSARTDFAAGLTLPRIEAGRAVDVLLWLGEGAFDLRYGRTLRALVRLLEIAGVDFAVLGPEERDCGDLARRLGDEATFQRLARDNIETLGQYGFRRIVTADPHALHVLRNEYPAMGGTYEVVHHTALLLELVEAGCIELGSIEAAPVTYHDPCYLGRYNGETLAPRRLLDKLGVQRVEMERSGLRSMCCGGGGGAPVSDVPGERRIPDLRMEQARSTGAAIVAVACPGCTAMLEGVVGPRPEVRDVAELVLNAAEQAR